MASTRLDGGERPLPSADPYEDGIRLLTWNIGGALEGEARAARDGELDHVARTLLELQPDLVFLQEVRSARQAALLLSKLGGDWASEVSRSKRGRQVVALVRGHALEAGPDLPVRGPLSVEVFFDDGSRMLAVGVYADAFSARKRNDLLGSVTDTMANVHGDLRMIAGDFNLDLDLDKRRDLFSDDAYLDVETYNYVSERFLDAARGSGATAEPDRRLDYVFLSVAADRVRAAGPIRGRRVGDMDHDPLIVDLAPIAGKR